MNKLRKFFKRDLSYSINNVAKWIPIIWSDRDYPYNSFFKILNFKLEEMLNHHKHHRIGLGSDKIIKQLEECVFLSKQIVEYNYFDEACELVAEEIGTNKFDLNTEKYSTHIAIKESELEGRDIQLLMNQLSKNIRRW